jgi:hypothetical protein
MVHSYRHFEKNEIMAKAIRLVPVDKDYRALLRSFSKMDDGAKNEMKKVASDLAERGARYAEGRSFFSTFLTIVKQ